MWLVQKMFSCVLHADKIADSLVSSCVWLEELEPYACVTLVGTAYTKCLHHPVLYLFLLKNEARNLK